MSTLRQPPEGVPQVPSGYEYFGLGPVPHRTDRLSRDIACMGVNGVQTDWYNKDGNSGCSDECHYALRIDSPIHAANFPQEVKQEPVKAREKFHNGPYIYACADKMGRELTDKEIINALDVLADEQKQELASRYTVEEIADWLILLGLSVPEALGYLNHPQDGIAAVRARKEAKPPTTDELLDRAICHLRRITAGDDGRAFNEARDFLSTLTARPDE